MLAGDNRAGTPNLQSPPLSVHLEGENAVLNLRPGETLNPLDQPRSDTQARYDRNVSITDPRSPLYQPSSEPIRSMSSPYTDVADTYDQRAGKLRVERKEGYGDRGVYGGGYAENRDVLDRDRGVRYDVDVRPGEPAYTSRSYDGRYDRPLSMPPSGVVVESPDIGYVSGQVNVDRRERVGPYADAIPPSARAGIGYNETYSVTPSERYDRDEALLKEKGIRDPAVAHKHPREWFDYEKNHRYYLERTTAPFVASPPDPNYQGRESYLTVIVEKKRYVLYRTELNRFPNSVLARSLRDPRDPHYPPGSATDGQNVTIKLEYSTATTFEFIVQVHRTGTVPAAAIPNYYVYKRLEREFRYYDLPALQRLLFPQKNTWLYALDRERDLIALSNKICDLLPPPMQQLPDEIFFLFIWTFERVNAPSVGPQQPANNVLPRLIPFACSVPMNSFELLLGQGPQTLPPGPPGAPGRPDADISLSAQFQASMKLDVFEHNSNSSFTESQAATWFVHANGRSLRDVVRQVKSKDSLGSFILHDGNARYWSSCLESLPDVMRETSGFQSRWVRYVVKEFTGPSYSASTYRRLSLWMLCVSLVPERRPLPKYLGAVPVFDNPEVYPIIDPPGPYSQSPYPQGFGGSGGSNQPPQQPYAATPVPSQATTPTYVTTSTQPYKAASPNQAYQTAAAPQVVYGPETTTIRP